jgi:hypothetical protein
MRHHWLHNGLAAVIGCHSHNAAKDLERSAIPVLSDIVKRGKPRVDKGSQILTYCLAAVPLSHAEAAGCILDEAVKSFAEGLVIDFLPEGQ